MNARVVVVIVNYRTPGLVVDCLASLQGERRDLPNLRAVVVEGGSGDASATVLADAFRGRGWTQWADLLVLSENRGFGAGNNAGVRRALSDTQPVDYVLLLNPDTIVRPGAVARLVEAMEANPAAGAAGSRLESTDGTGHYTAHALPRPWHQLDESAGVGIARRIAGTPTVTLSPDVGAVTECGWVSGASILLRPKALEQVGLFDESFFLYFEEVDLCRRIKAAGWSVYYVPASRVVHLGGQSTGIYEATRRRGRYWYESRRRYLLKHHGAAGLVVADALWALGRPVHYLRRWLRRPGAEPGPKYFEYDLLVGDLASLVRGGRSLAEGGR